MMIDAGAVNVEPNTGKYIIKAYPDSSRSPGEWIARYVIRRLAGIRDPELDVFLLSHFHGDHMGAVHAGCPKSSDGTYLLTGISEVESFLPVRKVIDRDYPAYSYPAPLTEDSQSNYLAFVRSLVRRGVPVERFQVGSKRQIRLVRQPSDYPDFVVQNIAANGEVWTGHGMETRQIFPAIADLSAVELPSENMCSIAVRISYGKFDYFTAGDMTCDTHFGRYPWRDIETPAARAAGPVDVALASHHGYMDATGPGYVSALRPRAFIVNAWDSAHPTIAPLHNMLSKELYPGDRDVFTTAMKHENSIATRRLAELKSQNGHVVVKVPKSQDSFSIYITSNSDEFDRVLASFGPYGCS